VGHKRCGDSEVTVSFGCMTGGMFCHQISNDINLQIGPTFVTLAEDNNITFGYGL